MERRFKYNITQNLFYNFNELFYNEIEYFIIYLNKYKYINVGIKKKYLLCILILIYNVYLI